MKDKLIDLVAIGLGVDADNVKMESHFIDDLGADSLDTVELVLELEDVFGIEIPDDEAEKLFTVADVYNYLKANVNDSNI